MIPCRNHFFNLDFGSADPSEASSHNESSPKQAKRTPECSAVLPFYPDEGETCGSSLFTCVAMPKYRIFHFKYKTVALDFSVFHPALHLFTPHFFLAMT